MKPRITPLARRWVLLACCAATLVGCAVQQRTVLSVRLKPDERVALLPIINHTDVPQAGLRAEAIAEATLRTQGLRQLVVYPPRLNPETLFEPGERKAQLDAEKWATGEKMRYAVYGSVEEWRYKVGVDGEPAVGLVFHIKDLETGQVVYSASGGRSGWSREALAAVAQKLTRELMSGIQIDASGTSRP